MNKFIFLCLLFLSSASWAEIPLDIEGKQWGETLSLSKACNFDDAEIKKFDKEILYLFENRNNSMPFENDYTIRKYKEYSAQAIHSVDSSDCIKTRESFDFIHELFKKEHLILAK